MSELKRCPICNSEVTMKKFYESIDGRGSEYPVIACIKCNLGMVLSCEEREEIDEKFIN